MKNKADTFTCKGITFYAQDGRFFISEPYGKDTEIDKDVYEGWKNQSLKDNALNVQKFNNISASRDIIPKYSNPDIANKIKQQEQEALELCNQILEPQKSKGFKEIYAAFINKDLAFASQAKKLALEVALAKHDGYIARLSFKGVVDVSHYFADVFWQQLFEMVGVEGISAFLILSIPSPRVNAIITRAYDAELQRRKENGR